MPKCIAGRSKEDPAERSQEAPVSLGHLQILQIKTSPKKAESHVLVTGKLFQGGEF